MSASRWTPAHRVRTLTIAAATLAAVALGGAGTYAFWNHTVTADAGTISAGDLDAASVGALTWTGAAGNEEDGVLGSDEEVWAVQGFDLALDGRNLSADVTVDVTLTADRDYPYRWFVSTDPAIADPFAAIDADAVPGLVLGPVAAQQGTLEAVTESDLPDALDGTGDWFVYVLVENPHPPEPGDPEDLDLLTVRTDLTLEQTS
ncbi:MAG: SipW-dependent-type signal peptide-containing protein [Actinomycetales bacterium]